MKLVCDDGNPHNVKLIDNKGNNWVDCGYIRSITFKADAETYSLIADVEVYLDDIELSVSELNLIKEDDSILKVTEKK